MQILEKQFKNQKFFLVLFKRDCDVKISYLLSFMLQYISLSLVFAS